MTARVELWYACGDSMDFVQSRWPWLALLQRSSKDMQLLPADFYTDPSGAVGLGWPGNILVASLWTLLARCHWPRLAM